MRRGGEGRGNTRHNFRANTSVRATGHRQMIVQISSRRTILGQIRDMFAAGTLPCLYCSRILKIFGTARYSSFRPVLAVPDVRVKSYVRVLNTGVIVFVVGKQRREKDINANKRVGTYVISKCQKDRYRIRAYHVCDVCATQTLQRGSRLSAGDKCNGGEKRRKSEKKKKKKRE